MQHLLATCFFLTCLLLSACQSPQSRPMAQVSGEDPDAFKFEYERFADVQVLAYQIPGFDELTARQKELIYYLYQASYSGRDIAWDQNYKYNLRVRRSLESIVRHYSGDRNTEEFQKFMTYTRQVWFANGIHHHYSTLKIQPQFSETALQTYFSDIKDSAELPLQTGESAEELFKDIAEIIFNPDIAAKKVNTTPGIDKVTSSATNFYEAVSEAEVRQFYAAKSDPADPTPVSHGLNSKLIKTGNGEIQERTWKVGGMYGEALEQVVYWLNKAIAVAENEKQRKSLELLVAYYRTGDLNIFDQYSIAWVEDTESQVDMINGFIEVYNDPIAYRGTFESVVSFLDQKTNHRIASIGAEAQWFEDHSPIMDEHKRERVQGILGKAITVIAEAGDSSPTTPVGINLPNASWIRENHGSKSVTIANIFSAYYSSADKSLQEFCWDDAELQRAQQYRQIAAALSVDMHEVIGHASGKINSGVGPTKETLRQYASTLEEARADLVALYYIMDQKLIDIGVMPSLEVGKAAYDRYLRSAMLTQLYRIKPGEKIEEAHMRNRALVAHWAFEKGRSKNVIERKMREGKTFFIINDYAALRVIFADLLRELQRIRSEGDFDAIQHLVENYGTLIDPKLHAEVLERFKPLNIAPYRGFVNPILTPVYDGNAMIDIEVHYPKSFDEQMLYYAEHYSFLPDLN